MKKVLISQPMGEKSAEQVREERKYVVDFFESRGYEILDNVFTDSPTEEVVNTNIFYLSKAIDLMTKADLVVFMPEWEKSRGCCFEYEIAASYDVKFEFIKRICEDSITFKLS